MEGNNLLNWSRETRKGEKYEISEFRSLLVMRRGGFFCACT